MGGITTMRKQWAAVGLLLGLPAGCAHDGRESDSMADEASLSAAAGIKALIESDPDLAGKIAIEGPRQGNWFTRPRSRRGDGCVIDLGPIAAIFHLATHPGSLFDLGPCKPAPPPVDERLKKYAEGLAERMFPTTGDPPR